MKRTFVLSVIAAAGCTTLGPMPASTGVSAIPSGRPGIEVQTAMAPAFYLSDAAHETTGGTATKQLSLTVEPDRLLGTRGLIAGVRRWGDPGDSPVEPMVGLRRRLDDKLALAGIAYGTRARGAEDGASYEAYRLGGELALDLKLLPLGRLVAIHLQGSASATWLDAEGTYCVRSDGLATDPQPETRRVDARVEGIYAAAIGGVSLDIARRPTGGLHSIRLALQGAVGGMPRLRDGRQERSAERYTTIGLSLTLGLGSDH